MKKWIPWVLAALAVAVVGWLSWEYREWLVTHQVKILIVLVLLVLTGVLSILTILLLANLGAFFTKIPQGTTVFISAGDKLKATWPNIDGYRMSENPDVDGRYWLVPAKDEDERINSFFSEAMPRTVWFQRWLWDTFGVRFVSWVWPHTNVYRFDLRKGGRRRIEARLETKPDAPLRTRVVDSPEAEKTTEVGSLLFLVPRPVYVEGAELAGDNSRINLLLLPVFQQVVPSLSAFDLKGDFFTSLDAAIEAAVVDFFASHRVAVTKGAPGEFAADFYSPPAEETEREEFKRQHGDKAYEEVYDPAPLTYFHWIKLKKAGPDSPFERHLHGLNISPGYLNRLEGEGNGELAKCVKGLIHEEATELPEEEAKKQLPQGIIPRFGFGLRSFRLVEWEAQQETKKLAGALLAKETERHTAEGVREKAAGERDALMMRATGESNRYERLLGALTKAQVLPADAAAVVATQIRTENIGGEHSKVVTYVEGGASVAMTVPTSTKP